MATGIGCMQQQQQADPQAASEHEINGVPTNTLHSCRKIKKKTKERIYNNNLVRKIIMPLLQRTVGSGMSSMSLVLINLAATMERADESLLPAVYKEVSEAFHLSPSQLGVLTFVRILVQALCSPLAGLLAVRYNRSSVIGLGTLLWAFSTAALAVAVSFTQCTLSRAVNGVGLAIVIPALQSFIADSYLEEGRGVGFGLLNLVGAIGGIAGSLTATLMAGHTYLGVPGWRTAFLVGAVASTVIGCLVHTQVQDPSASTAPAPTSLSCQDSHQSNIKDSEENTRMSIRSAWRESSVAMKAVLKVPTFQVIILQGIFGTLAGVAQVFFTMWLELIGFSHKATASLLGVFYIGAAIGVLLGGWMGDKIERNLPGKGRIMCAQFSSFMAVPTSFFLLILLPQDAHKWALFAEIFLLMGLTITWCQSCANNPIFAEVVPERYRTMVYAFDRAIELSFGALAAPAVGILAERVFGYDVSSSGIIIPDSGSPAEARALSRGVFWVIVIPSAICSLLYTFLYFTYVKDRAEARAYDHSCCIKYSNLSCDSRV